MKNAVTTGDGVGRNTVRDRSAIHALPPQRMWSLPWEPLLVYLPFFALAAVFGRLSAAAFDALLDVETATFVTLPLLELDAVGLL
ncbi:MAG TPA: hypothetical protein VGM85_18580, partial [Paraburkholderia sp.]